VHPNKLVFAFGGGLSYGFSITTPLSHATSLSNDFFMQRYCHVPMRSFFPQGGQVSRQQLDQARRIETAK
jgi:hypothetical protein